MDTFAALDTILGRIAGETVGYLNTVVFTILVVRAFSGRLISLFRTVSATLVTCDVLGIRGADLANFVGYPAWRTWLVTLAVAQ